MIIDCYGMRFSNLTAFLDFYCIDEDEFKTWRNEYLEDRLILPSTEVIIEHFANPDVMQSRLNEFLRKRHGTENHGA